MTEDPNTANPGRESTAVDITVGAAVAVSALAAANGFSSFEVPQALGAAVLVLIALVVSLLGFRRAAPKSGPGVWAAMAFGGGAAWIGVAAAAAGRASAMDEVAVPWLIAAVAVIAVIRSTRVSFERWSVAVAVVAVVSAAASMAQAFGMELPAAIPFVTLPVPGRATFDGTSTAAAWFGMAGAISLAATRRSMVVGMAGLVAAGVGLGLSGEWAAVLVAALAALAGAVIGLGNVRTLAAAFVPGALGALVIGSGLVAMEPTDGDMARLRTGVVGLETGAAVVDTEPGSRTAAFRAVSRYARAEQPFGAGPGGFVGRYAEFADPDTEYAVAHTDGVLVPERSPSPVLELSGDAGFGPPMLLLLGLLLSLAAAARRRDGVAAMGVVIGLGLFAASSGFGSASVAVLVGLACASAASGKPEGAAVPGPPLVALVAVLLVLGSVATVHGVRTARWSMSHAAAIVFLGHGRMDEGARYARRAAEIQVRFASEINAGHVERIGEEGDRGAAQDHFQNAVELRPASVAARSALADVYIRSAVTADDRDERVGRARRMYDALADLDPNNVGLAIRRANASMALFDTDAAVAALNELLERPIDVSATVIAWERLGEVYEDAEKPEDAQRAYEAAADAEPDEERAARFRARAERMARWAETGSRPREAHEPH